MWKRYAAMLTALAAVVLLLTVNRAPVQAQATFGVNWTATFFTETNFTGTTATASYPSGLNFNWAGVPTQADGITPVAGFPDADFFSVRFISSQTFATTTTYRFSGFVDDSMTVLIDGISVYTQGTPGNFTFDYALAAGLHSIQIDFVEQELVSVLQFQWQPVTGGVTPTLAPGVTATPAGPTGPIGQVVTVRGLSLRTGPYLGASFIAVLRPGISYPVSAQNNDEGGGFTWYKVTDGERTGWASGRYLVVTNGEPPFESTVFETLDNPPSTGIFATPNAFMNLRVRPSVRSFAFDQIPWGGSVEVLGRTIQGGRNHWLLVRYNGQVGWAYAPYFRSTRGSINAAPTY